MLNHITIMGRLTRDPEYRTTNNGKSVASFAVACDRDFGEKQTDFVDCVAWGQTAEFVRSYFSKGRGIVVDGSLQSRKWQDKDGNNRTSWEVNAQSVYFADSKREESAERKRAEEGAEKKPVKASDFSELEDDDGDLPF